MRLNTANHKADQSKDYDDLLQEITIQKPKEDIFDKKYFDYLPADEINSASLETNDRDEDSTKDDDEPNKIVDIPLLEIEFEQLADDNNEELKNAALKHEGKANGRRIKRSNDFQGFIDNERRRAFGESI